MNDFDKVISNLGYLLMIISIVFICTDTHLLVSHWGELFAHDSHKMIGGGIPPKEVLFYDIFRWSLLLIGGIGLVSKNVLGWIFLQTFVLLTFCTAAINLFSDFARHYENINWNYFSTLIIASSIMVFVFKVFNWNTMKENMNVDKYPKIWLWSGILILNVIGILILEA